MLKRLKRIILILPLFITAFSPIDNNNNRVEFYYNLRFMKKSSSPQKMKILNIKDVAYQRGTAERGVLITYKNRRAKEVKIAGNFSNWKSFAMDRGNYGVWYYFISENNHVKGIKYKLSVDEIWITDPKNLLREDDGQGGYISVIHIDYPKEGRHLSYRFVDSNCVEFRIYKPKARFIALVGDFNNWNPENDLLNKGKDGIWRLKKRLPPGEYRYKYVIDGKWIVDLYNFRTASDGMGSVSSIINIK
ncbi:MAG: hypothetical protein SVZ03_01500 [Spirochaetota bacterium]|nr:hypothetical protein [Spirochaetota bacterium]